MTLCSCQSSKEATVAEQNEYRFLALGDSYTIGESVPDDKKWPVQLRDSLIKRGEVFDEFKIIATTGWRTDDLSKAIGEAQLTNDYNLVSLLIGVNNQYQSRPLQNYGPEFEILLNKAVELAGGIKENVFVLSIPDYGYTPFGQQRNNTKISEELIDYNAICKRITIDNNIKHIDITTISFRAIDEPNLVAADGLHPSADQYTLWVREILEQYFN